MMTTKVDVYTKIHKAQRQHLFAISTKVAKIDVSDIDQMSELKLEIKTIIEHLRRHVEHEEQFIHPVLAEFGDQADILHLDHEMLEKSLHDLENTLSHYNNIEIYTQLNRFIAVYLKHIDEEENAQREILWQQCSNEKLMKIMENFQKSMTPQQIKRELTFILPCLNIQEIKEILEGIKKNAPSDFFEDIWQIAQNNLSLSDQTKMKLN